MSGSAASLTICRAAQNQRDLLGPFRDSAILDVQAFLERYHPITVVHEHGWDGGLSAVMVKRPRPEKTVVGVNALHPLGRRNFSLAHELGHWLLHTDYAAGRESPGRERQADLFALEFLLPERLVRSWCEAYSIWSPGRLARRLCLSTSVVCRRVDELAIAPS